MYGFGAKTIFPNYKSQQVEHCFPMTGNLQSAEVLGLPGILQTYEYAVRNVRLAGPTYFGGIL